MTGGPPTKICDAPGGSDGSWSPEGVILFDGTGTDPIYRVPAAGGTQAVAVKLDAAKQGNVGRLAGVSPRRQALPLPGHRREAGGQRLLDRLDRLEGGASSLPGPDARDLRAAGLPPLRPRQDARRPALRCEGHEDDGRAGAAGREDRHGQRRPGALLGVAQRRAGLSHGRGRRAAALAGSHGTGARSPRGSGRLRQSGPLALRRSDRLQPHRCANRQARTSGSATSREASTPASASAPATTSGRSGRPTARRSSSSSDRDGLLDLYEKSTQGQGVEKLLLKNGEPKSAAELEPATDATSPTPARTRKRMGPLGAADLRRPQARSRSLVAPFVENTADVLARRALRSRTSSNESGRAEIYVQTFPDGGGKWQVSNAGGVDPSWRGDGKELFYRAPDQKLMAVEIRTAGATSRPASRRPCFPISIRTGNARNKYMPSPRTASGFSSTRRSAARP